MGALKGKPKSPEHQKALSISQKGRHYSPATEFKKGCISTFMGKHHSEESKAKLRQSLRGKHSSPATEFKKGQKMPWATERNRKISANPRTKEKHREISKELCQDPVYIEKISHPKEMRHHLSKLKIEQYREDPTLHQRISKATKLGMSKPEARRNLMSAIARRSEDPEWFKKVMRSRRPTDIEQKLIDVITKYNLPYKYTGNGTFKVNGKYPDFVNTNSQKIAIDIFGDYWHSPDEVPKRKAAFAEYGWKLVILWGHEINTLSEEELLEELRG